jgi:hypothetical protein
MQIETESIGDALEKQVITQLRAGIRWTLEICKLQISSSLPDHTYHSSRRADSTPKL